MAGGYNNTAGGGRSFAGGTRSHADQDGCFTFVNWSDDGSGSCLGTPHIARYSFDGKLDGTVMVYRDACRFFERPATWDSAPLRPPPAVPEIRFDPSGRDDEESLRELTRHRKETDYLSAVRRRIEDLEQMLQTDLGEPDLSRDAGWDAESLRADFGKPK